MAVKRKTNPKQENSLNVPEGDIVVDAHVEPLGESKDIDTEDFVQYVYLNIKEIYGEDAANAFLSNPEFSNYKQYNPTLQRLLVNRVLTKRLLIFRARSNVPVVDVVYCLIPDGNNGVWMDVFQKVVLPFLVANQVKL